MSREATNKLIEMIDEQLIDSKDVVMMCLKYMSEDEVKDMCAANEIDLEEIEIDEEYHDYSEDELRKMGCFDNLDDEEDAQDAYDQDEETNRDSYLTSLF